MYKYGVGFIAINTRMKPVLGQLRGKSYFLPIVVLNNAYFWGNNVIM